MRSIRLTALCGPIIIAIAASAVFSQKISSDSSHPVIKDRPQPTWPTSVKKVGDFTVVLRAVFRSNGKVTDISRYELRPEHPDGLSSEDIDKFFERAIEAAVKIRFKPATKDGHPVSMWMQLEYNFNDPAATSQKHKKN